MSVLLWFYDDAMQITTLNPIISDHKIIVVNIVSMIRAKLVDDFNCQN